MKKGQMNGKDELVTESWDGGKINEKRINQGRRSRKQNELDQPHEGTISQRGSGHKQDEPQNETAEKIDDKTNKMSIPFLRERSKDVFRR